MSQRERDRLKTLHQVTQGHLTQKQAAEQLSLSPRQVGRLLRRLRAEGDSAVIHRQRGKPSNHRLTQDFRSKVLERYRERYPDFGPTLACEHLAKDGLVVGRETLRKWLASEGIRCPKRRKVKEIHVWRERRPCFGELVQLDASPFAWLENRGPHCHLIALIDDATSRIWGHFAESDCTTEEFIALEGWLKRHGRPVALYTDRSSIYTVNRPSTVEEQLTDTPPLTQFGRAVKELGIEWIPARSPQAKGRVERLFGTLQDRLVKELRLAGASTISAANRYLQEEFLPFWERRFTVEAREALDVHRPLEPHQRLAEILSHREKRTVGKDLTVSFQGQRLGVARDQALPGLAGARVEVERRRDGSLWVRFREQVLPLHACPKAVPVAVVPSTPSRKAPHKPRPDHPWRKPFLASGQKEDR